MDSKSNRFSNLLRSNTTVLVLITIIVFIVFWLINPNFLSVGNIRNIMISMSFDGLLALGVGIALLAGEVDLSSGAVACVGGCLTCMITNNGVPWFISMAIGVIVGLMLGLIHAFLINQLRFMSFITTLATAQIYRGAVKLALGNRNTQITDPNINIMGRTIGIFPLAFIIMVILMIIYGIILSRRKLGRSIYMVGGNKEAARLAGINLKRVSFFVYINCAGLCALAGTIAAARLHTGSPDTGTNGETTAMTAAVLGGISFMGGSGTVFGCFIGVLLLDAFNVGLTAIGFPSYGQIIARGALLIVALVFDSLTTSRRKKRLEIA